jgi:hypothetical protein
LYVGSSGSVGVGTTTPARKLEVLDISSSAQIRLSQSSSVYSEIYLDSVGDLRLSATGGNIRALNENLWVCENGSCALSDPSTKGNLIVENSVIFDNGFKIKKTAEGLTVYSSTTEAAILIFDDVN